MKRQIILKGGSEILAPGGSLFPGTSDYVHLNTPSKKLYEVWNLETPTVGQYVGFWPVNSPLRIAMGFVLPPTLILVEKMVITAGVDYSQSGDNSWWFPPNNAHGPSAALILRKRDLTTWHVGTGGAAHVFTEGEPYNVNINTDPTLYRLFDLSWTLLNHPEGGIFTPDDLRDGGVGIEFDFSVGPNGLAYDTPGHSFFKVRVPYVTVTLDVDDLGGQVAGPRHSASLWLRMMSKPRNSISPTLLEHSVLSDVGERVGYSHPRGPSVGGDGWGRRKLETEQAIILKRVYSPGQGTNQDESFDLKPYVCLGCGVYRIQGPWSSELQGVMLLDKGRQYIHTRDLPDAWSPRPGDGVLMRVIEDYPNVSFEGLAISGGGDVEIVKQNFNPKINDTDWTTVGLTGDTVISNDLTTSMVEERGYTSSCQFLFGVSGGTGGRAQTVGTLPRASGHYVHATVKVKNINVADPLTQFMEWYLLRSGGGLSAPEYWDNTSREWTTTPIYNAIPSSDPYGESIADAVPCDASGASSDPTYQVAVGRFSSAIVSATFNGAIVSVQHTDSTVTGARPPLVTLASQLTRVADTHIMEHVWGRELWVHERGVAMVEVRPWYRSELLASGTVFPLIHAQHATDTHDALQFVTGPDVIRFERAISGETTFQLDCPITTVVNRSHVIRAWVRYLGADGWTRYGPYSVEVGVLITLASDGSVVERKSVIGRLVSETSVPYDRDYVGIGYDGARQANAWIRAWETRRNPLYRQEIEKL